jgi:hypothetical protein
MSMPTAWASSTGDLKTRTFAELMIRAGSSGEAVVRMISASTPSPTKIETRAAATRRIRSGSSACITGIDNSNVSLELATRRQRSTVAT